MVAAPVLEPDAVGRAYTHAAVSRHRTEIAADWAMLVAALALLASLFMVWSHELSPAMLQRYADSGTFTGVPADPNAWQVYTAADVLLALLALGLIVAALLGDRVMRLVLLGAVAIALAFVVHALGTPPTDGASVFDAATGRYLATGATAGPGELVALIALSVAAAALLLSFAADRR